jgi:MoxR-like ATPase
MTYTDDQIAAALSAVNKYRAGDDTEVGAALAVVGLSAERAGKEAEIRDDMIRVAHRAGASLRQLAEVSGLDRKTVTAIVGAAAARRPRRGTSKS